MANQSKKNLVETMMDAQKQVVDTVMENTRKLANGNSMVNEAVAKGSEWYNNWLDSQKEFYTAAAGKTTEAGEKAKETATQFNQQYTNWFNNQSDRARQIWESNMNFMKNMQGQNGQNADFNPMTSWMNAWNNWTNMVNSGAQAQNWMSQMQQFNPFQAEGWKKMQDSATTAFNQYYEVLNNAFAQLQKNIEDTNIQDAYRNMVNVNEGFARFYEMWAPVWKSIQDKTFNPDTFKQYLNPELYKDLMDKYFGFMPDSARQYFQKFGTFTQDGMKQAGAMGWNNYNQLRNMFSAMPGFHASDFFSQMLNGYNSMYNSISSTVAPLTRMITPNQYTKSMVEWADIANRLSVYNIKNAELQYMIYTQGEKVLDKLAESIHDKMQNGQEMNSVMALYQEWLNIGDKVYVSLFESDDYSKLMAEVSALQLRLRKDIEDQTEKFLVGIPVATRSEMDELYKTIYDLKKQVRQLEKMLEVESEEIPEEPVAKKTTTRKK